MKKVRLKTDAEKAEEAGLIQRVKVSDTMNWFWVCDTCNMAYFGDDEILHVKDKAYMCLNEKVKCGALFSFLEVKPLTRKCTGRVTGGTEDYFNRNYKIIE
jgi:hypothetical protein